jgi:hypothetical protein
LRFSRNKNNNKVKWPFFSMPVIANLYAMFP